MLTAQLLAGMKKIPGVHILGSGDEKEHCGIVSFTVDDVHPHDIASILDEAHVAVRVGHPSRCWNGSAFRPVPERAWHFIIRQRMSDDFWISWHKSGG